jgi:hypothetical protein
MLKSKKSAYIENYRIVYKQTKSKVRMLQMRKASIPLDELEKPNAFSSLLHFIDHSSE